MSVPGTGLLALLRKQSEAPPTGAASKFAASSAAVAAVEHSVASGAAREQASQRPASHGRRVPHGEPGEVFTFDIDTHQPQETRPQLPVAPITLVASPYAQQHWHQVATGAGFICYGLKQGHVRVLSRRSAARTLLRGHTAPIRDLSCVQDARGGCLLASGGQDGLLLVWGLEAPPAPEGMEPVLLDRLLLRATFPSTGGVAPAVCLAWQEGWQATGRPPLLAAAAGGRAFLLDPHQEGLELDIIAGCDIFANPKDGLAARKLSGWPEDEEVTALAFSPDGSLLAAGGAAGTVRLWREDGNYLFEPVPGMPAELRSADGAVGGLAWLPAGAGGSLLLVSDAHGSTLDLWRCARGGGEGGAAPAELLQRLELTCKDGRRAFFNHLATAPLPHPHRLVLLADTPHREFYALHVGGEEACARIDYITRFEVAVPVLSFAAAWEPEEGEEDAGAVELVCVQTTAVQQHTLDPSLCMPPPLSVEIGRSSTLLERPSPEAAAPAGPQAPAPVQPPPGTDVSRHASDASSFESEAPSSEAPTPEECPSPPPSPATSRAASSAAAPRSEAPGPVELPQPQVAPALPPTGASAQPAARHSPSPGDIRQLPSARILLDVPSASRPLPLPSAAPTTDQATKAATKAAATALAEQRAAAAAATAAVATAAAAAGPPVAPARHPAVPAAVADVGPAVAAAVAQQLEGSHKKYVGHVSLMYKELLKAVRSEVAQQAAATQAATAAAVTAALEEQRQQVAADRASVVAEEREGMGRLLAMLSSAINTELPSRLREIVREELAQASGAIAAAAVPPVVAAVQAALPKEVSSAVRASLDKALPTAVASALAKPAQEAFRTAFSKTLVPAFEGACQSMFVQLNGALAQGLEEHTQATRVALSEPLSLAHSLRDSLATAQALSGRLSAAGVPATAPAPAPPPPPVVDVRAELGSLLQAGRYDEAFSRALGLQDTATVGWLCAQQPPGAVLGLEPPPLSQLVVLSLIQQLSADLLSGEVASKLSWVREAALALAPGDPAVAAHARPVLAQAHASLGAAAGALRGADASACKLAMHVVHSQMTS